MANMAKIRRLNDLCRKAIDVGGQLIQTAGVKALPMADQTAIKEQVVRFDGFNESNDPLGERDFGSFEYNGNRVFWKIDYHDPTTRFASTDPTDPTQTVRVLTIMLAEEY